MAVIGTFGSFTAARLGIYASQSSLNVTGNNIANINTEGYTRQRMDLVSLYSYGYARYANNFQQNIGYGVLTNSVSQLRDPFLDIRFREENASSGAYQAKLDCLQQLSNILDEVGKGNGEFGIIAGQLGDLLGQLQNLNGKAGEVVNDSTVRGSAQTLAWLFNSYSQAMDTLAANKLNELKENVKTVNALLTQIRDLNVQIRDAGIVGDPALELRDARNLCIDQLSAYMKIDVRYDEEKIDEFNSVERINISIADSGSPPIKLIEGVYGTQLSMPDMVGKKNLDYDPTIAPPANNYEFISKNSDFSDPANPKIVYTNDIRKAYFVDKDGNQVSYEAYEAYKDGESPLKCGPLRNIREVLEEKLNAIGYTGDVEDVDGFVAFFNGDNAPYLMENGEGTYFAELAEQVDNAIEGSEYNQLTMFVEALRDVKGRYMRDKDHKEIKDPVELSDTQLYGSLQSIREFLTEKGEFSSDEDLIYVDKYAAQKRGLPYYQKALDALARKFAEAFNQANQLNFSDVGAAYVGKEGPADPPDPNDPDATMITFGTRDDPDTPVLGVDGAALTSKYFDDLAEKQKELAALKEKAAKGGLKAGEADTIKTLEQEIEVGYQNLEILRNQGQLTERWSFYNGGVLFSNNGDNNDGRGITARNITISKDWIVGDVRILNTKVADGIDHSTGNDNILHMIALMNEDMNYFPGEITDGAMYGGARRYFTGSFAERLADMNSILSVETNTTGLLYNEYTATTLSLENSRQSVAGVDLNDEATNMMVFQKSYAAACQLMTTLDSMLDKLINGTLR